MHCQCTKLLTFISVILFQSLTNANDRERHCRSFVANPTTSKTAKRVKDRRQSWGRFGLWNEKSHHRFFTFSSRCASYSTFSLHQSESERGRARVFASVLTWGFSLSSLLATSAWCKFLSSVVITAEHEKNLWKSSSAIKVFLRWNKRPRRKERKKNFKTNFLCDFASENKSSRIIKRTRTRRKVVKMCLQTIRPLFPT